jgi:hypothetical protein
MPGGRPSYNLNTPSYNLNTPSYNLNTPSYNLNTPLDTQRMTCLVPPEVTIDVRHGLSKGVEDGRRPLALQAGHSWNGLMAMSKVAPKGYRRAAHGKLRWNYRESMATPCHAPMEVSVPRCRRSRNGSGKSYGPGGSGKGNATNRPVFHGVHMNKRSIYNNLGFKPKMNEIQGN